MKRLRDAIKAQTDYTIAVSISNCLMFLFDALQYLNYLNNLNYSSVCAADMTLPF